MIIRRNKNLAARFLVLVLTVTLLTMTAPTAKAAEIYTEATVSASPDPIGVNQTIQFIGDINPNPPIGYDYNNLQFVVTMPDGTQVTSEIYNSDSRGGVTIGFMPSMVGFYHVRFCFLGETMPNDDYYLPSEAEIGFVVQEAPVGGPIASFTFNPESPMVDQTVNFDASGSSDPEGNIVAYDWDFGDGTVGTGITATHSYSSAGIYYVALIVTDNDGLTGIAEKPITITEPEPTEPEPTEPEPEAPEASFTSSPGSPEYGEIVTFDASGSTDPDGTIVNYVWDFGDGNTGSGVTATHSYATVGTYGVTLTVTDNDGLTATALKEIFVIATGVEIDEEPPVADAGNDLTVETGSIVAFDASRSTDNVGIVSYAWDFGDGNTGTGITPTHAYETEGTYIVTLTVTDAAGNFNTVTILTTVEEEAAAEFPFWVLIPIIATIVAVVVVWYFLKKRKPKEKAPKPAKIKMMADPTEVLADGKSTSTIIIELVDEEGRPVQALADTEIQLTTTGGKMRSPVVRVPKGKGKGTTVLVSSTTRGKTVVSAKAKGLKRADTTVEFVEKPRFCMGCGSRMAVMDKKCGKCGASAAQFTGIAKVCKNCERNGKTTYLPATAEFCSECGASQPK